jgi:HD-GYP domain-containing protein (c-di-GMP phosphodiesterase class II)
MCDLHQDGAPGDPPASDPSGLVDELVVALSNARIYRPEHPRVTGAAQALESGLADWFQSHPDVDRCEIGMADGFLFHAKRPLVGVSLSATRLLEPLRLLRSGGVAFQHGVSAEELLALVALLCPRKLEPANFSEANAALAQRGVTRVRLLPPYRHEGLGLAVAQTLDPKRAAELDAGLVAAIESTPRAVYQGTVALLQDSALAASRGEAVELDAARGVIERLQKRMLDDASTMLGLARYERYDEFTFGHSIRVCMLALQFGWVLLRDEQQVQRLGLAALMHDIGKSRVPFELLHARRRLDAAEREQIGRHAELGAEILLGMPDADLMAVGVAFSHHRPTGGGTGYPRTADGSSLSLATKMVRICDVFEALTAVRPYKERMSPQRAYRIMMGMKGHFDPGLLRRFIQVTGAYPVGSRVVLASGETARVERQTADVLFPVVRLERTAASGQVIVGHESRDLSERRAGEGWRVSSLVLTDEAA